MTIVRFSSTYKNGATLTGLSIDGIPVPTVNGNGVHDADPARPEHRVYYRISGFEGASMSWEIKQGATTLKKAEITVNPGQTEANGWRPFKLI